MSVHVSSWCWRHSKSNGNDRLVLLTIADMAEDDGTNAWPSYATIASRCLISERTAQRCVDRLEELGELRVARRAGPAREGRTNQRSNVYSFPAYRTHEGFEKRRQSVTSSEEAEEVTPGGRRGDTGGRRGDTAMSGNTSFDSSVVDPSFDPSCRATVTDLFGGPLLGSRPGPEPGAGQAGDLFEEFWQTYPRNRVKKQEARKAWAKATKIADPREMINAAARYAGSRRGEPEQFTAHASTWLNGQRWLDEPEYARNGSTLVGDKRGGGERYARHFEHIPDEAYDAPMNY